MRVSDARVRKDSRLFEELCSALLRRGHAVQFRVNGESMRPNLRDGDDVLVAPASARELERGDVVLAENAEGLRVHRVSSRACASGGVILRSDTGHDFDPPASRVFGRVVSRRHGSEEQTLTPLQTRFVHPLRVHFRRLQAAARLRLRRITVLFCAIVSSFLVCATFLAPAIHAQTADLAVTSDTVAPATISPGGQVTYTVAIINNGPNTAVTPTFSTSTPAYTTLAVAFACPAGWTIVSAPAVGGTGTISCQKNTNLTFNSTATFTVVVQVNLGTAGSTPITNSVDISSTTTDPNLTNNTASVSATVITADLQLVQTASAAAVAAGANYTYSEVVTNNASTSTVTSGTVTAYMQTPANTNFQAYAGTNWACTNGSGGALAANYTGPLICTYNNTLASGTSASALTFTMQVAAGTASGTTIQSSATVTNSTFGDPNPANNTSISSIYVEPTTTSDLAVSMSVSPTPVFVSSTFTYNIQIQNLGQASAPVTSGALTDTLPNGVTYVSSTASAGWSCSGTTTISCNITSAMAMGSSATITITVTSPSGATTLNNAAQINLPITTDPNTLNNTATAYTVVQPLACATPGRDGGGVTLGGIVNAYYPPSATGTLASGSTSLVLGAAASGGAQTPITAGDLLLIIQMQGAALNSTNTSSYGDGLPGDPGSGSTSLGSSGLFEFVTASNPSPVPVTGGTLQFTGTGPTGGLLNHYSYVAPITTSSLGTASAATWLNNVATFTFPGALPATVVPNSVLTTTGFAPASYNLTNVPILSVNNATGVITVALASNPGAVTTKGTGSASTQGQQTYQVIRVPQYTSVTLSSSLVPLAWNGSVGGVLAIDVSSQLTLGGTLALDALGFRGGGGRILTGTGTGAITDYVTAATNPANGSKGEGIAGTPRYLVPATFTTITTATDTTGGTPADTLPVGSYARGAPGNAGGGGTDGNASNNSENSGGGAGGNGGTGGQGGYGWNSMAATNSTDGGFGGVAFPASTSALVMGGGGGAGTTNDGSYYISSTSSGADCGATCTGIYSSGGMGGGIAIIHAGSVVGAGTITSNGQSTLSTLNDSTGGGGAGGSVLLFANSGGLSGLTVNAIGGTAGNAWPIKAPGGFPGQRHGPGGGGGGGVIFLSDSHASTNVAGGMNGNTDTVQDSYGATPGLPGLVQASHVITETPGTQSGAYCGSADLAVTNSAVPVVVSPGGTITYTQTVKNNGPLEAVNAVFTEGIPANTTFSSINTTGAPGWTCVTTGPITCTNPDVAKGATASFTVVVTVASGTPNGTQIIDVDNVTSGTIDPNLANNTATAITTVAVAGQADLAVTNTASAPTVLAGSNFTMTAVVSNNGPATASSLSFTETTASNAAGTQNATFVSLVAPSGWSCTTPTAGSTGTITCTAASMAAGSGTATFSVVLNVPSSVPSGTLLLSTANIASSTPDPNSGNNSATASILVATAGQADLAVSSSGMPNPVTAGNNITYAQSITNNGPAPITIGGSTTVTFTDQIPANTTLASAFTQPVGWTCNTIALGGTGTFICTLNSGQTLAVGAIVNFPLVVKVNAGTAPNTTITNSPNIASTVSDPNTANNTATVNTIVASPTESSVTVTKTASPEPVDQGTTLTYTLMVTNSGPAVAQSITVTDPLPPEVTYIPNAYSTTAGSCSGTTTVTCSLGNIAVGSTAVVTINVTATTFSASSLSTNTATVTTTSSVPNIPTSLGTATNATWASNIATFTFPTPLTAGGVNSPLTTTGFTPAGYNIANAPILSVNTTTGVITVAMTTNPGPPTATAMGTGSSTYPLYATAISTIQAPTAVDISSFHAFSQSDGSVRLVWRTHEESRNLGFHIYREDASGRTRIDPSLIAGSALLLRGGQPQHAAKLYALIDSEPAPNAGYWIEDVDINGSRTMHGPAYPESASAEQLQSLARAQTVETPQADPSLSHLHGAVRRTTSTHRLITRPRPVFPAPPAGTRLFNATDHQAVKISVDQEGWYDIPFSQLFSSGLSPNTDLRSLHLYAEGIEQPLLLVGHSSGMASASDAIEFYGTGIDTPFSATRIYWLVAESSYGKRILTSPASSSGTIVSASFPFTVVREDRTTYFAALLNGENNDNFFGDVVTSVPVGETLNVAHRDTSSPVLLRLDLSLQGVTDQQQHSVFVQLNGANLGTFEFYGQILASQSFSVDPSQVLDGTNTVTLTAQNGDNDVSAVQSVELHYAHTYTADADWLRATGQAGTEVHISDFTNSQVRVFDISDPLNITELTGKVVPESGSYGITVALPREAPESRTFLAFANDALSAPLALEQHAPTFLDDSRAGADIVMVTYPDFASHLMPLVRLHESEGHHVDVVTTEQIFDEFNYGERSPFAIRSFLQDAATHWRRKPQAVLLVGDASMDPRNYLGLGDFDFVPTRIIETAAFKTASDDWLTDFQQNGFATIPTGRLPVRTTADADLLVSKIVSYEQGEFSGPWNSQAVLISDQNIDANFTAVVNTAAGSLPASLHTTQILADGADPATVRSQIIAALDNGALLVDYNGHGAEQQWSFSDLFDDTDASALTNGGRLPVYLLMDCLNGLFQDVYAQSLAKSLMLAPNGGAVAVWASSGFTQQAPQASMNLAFLHQMAAHPNYPLGRLVLNAKANTTDNDVRRTWILFGDPSLKFHFPAHASSTPGSISVSGRAVPGNSNRACARETACAREIQ
jgi:uncharacterized repeat protein (TIGR01451 family)